MESNGQAEVVLVYELTHPCLGKRLELELALNCLPLHREGPSPAIGYEKGG